ncbi:predicted protein [Histoplasma mississippiense (nom. inval.)]|uniref:predicted protein n=1 Tax=Ajellomyces capsulatus (strain NAm1 / WU24) TaxID=2059318 RepID=UPI000157B8C2|nr:predicted protein [Histoplasma mississippiense (nom. inval.)]EDN03751.1 predicted protein [Histoplasma mississippiense (nom. inval.)]
MSELEAERPTSFASWLLVLKMDYRLCWSLRYERCFKAFAAMLNANHGVRRQKV